MEDGEGLEEERKATDGDSEEETDNDEELVVEVEEDVDREGRDEAVDEGAVEGGCGGSMMEEFAFEVMYRPSPLPIAAK
jgi:hypothetical protein